MSGAGQLSDVKRALLEVRLREERARRSAREGLMEPLVPLQPKGGRPAFYCVHASSGSAFPYMPLARRVGDDQPFYGLVSRGLDAAGPPLETFEDMAACYLAAVRAHQPEGPYRIGGWSIGATIAVEMARQLAARACEVVVLVMIDTAQLDPADPADPEKCIRWFVHDLASMVGAPVPDVEDVLRLGPRARLARLRQLLVERGLVPAEMDAVSFERRIAVHEANIMAFNRYRPGRYGGDALVLYGADGLDPRWRDMVGRGAVYRQVPGDHYGMLRPPQVDVLARHVRGALVGPGGSP